MTATTVWGCIFTATLWLLWIQLIATPAQAQQLMWTTIYVDGKSQVDLWTQSSKGCQCPWEKSNYQCACCVADGGCSCGRNSPNRCTQCGLQNYCHHMCNITISSAVLKEKSGKTFGQIKSPSLEGPDVCWYTFVPNPNQRVEIQVYRLESTGKFNGTSCVGGYLQLMSGAEPQYSVSDNQVCGPDERYTPPVVFFADDGLATLLFQITEKTGRSRFLAYFSFTSRNNTEGLAYQPKGGLRLQNTDCDWLYQDFACNKSEQGGVPCTLASPGYPGVYPPHRQCKYHITTSNENVQVKITFTAMQLPPSCKSDHISIYQGSTTSSPLLIKLCGSQKKTFEYSGLNLLLLFSSGAQKPPFSCNGFVATIKFYERNSKTDTPTITTITNIPNITSTSATDQKYNIPIRTTASTNLILSSTAISGCDILISGNNTRSGHFDTREREWHPICRLIFNGRTTDVVHISLFNYRLRMSSCKSAIEIIDNGIEDKRSVIEKICSPIVKQTGDKTSTHKTFLSSGNTMIIVFRRPFTHASPAEAEFVTGAYFFHDEQISGTMEPAALCDVKYNGVNSPLAGMIDNPGSRHIFKNINGPLTCKQKFVPSTNQSITIKVQQIANISKQHECVTQCGDHGCNCVSSASLKDVDHLMLIGENRLIVACLCGNFLNDWLPISVRTWGSLAVVYSVAHYSWDRKGFGFSASYLFNTDAVCGDYVSTVHSGEITMKNLTPPDNLNNFYLQSCTWTLHSNVERQLELNISSVQNRPCTAWNITIYDYVSDPAKQHLGNILHTFCSRENNKLLTLPWKLNTVVVRLFTISRTLPQFKIKWRSQVVRANTRYVAASPEPKASSSTSAKPTLLGLYYVFYYFHSRLYFLCDTSGSIR